MGTNIVFPAIGLVLIVLGILILVQRVRLVLGSKVIDGKVIDIQTKFERGGLLYFAVIEYYNEESHTMERFTDGVGSFPSNHEIGDTVKLRYYNNQNKKELITNTWFVIWGAPVVVILMGAVFIIMGL